MYIVVGTPLRTGIALKSFLESQNLKRKKLKCRHLFLSISLFLPVLFMFSIFFSSFIISSLRHSSFFIPCFFLSFAFHFFIPSSKVLKIYPVRNPTFGIYNLQSLQLHFPPPQHLICFLKMGRLFDCFISCGKVCHSLFPR